ncbi:hypothetical protein Pan97_24780 [Bremerella volcania]|uniref:Uncharacterized protein n=1 Tax=Bremerella volcania TaxID=2527984 RepID=A0A518C889_9BACT|nr:hypothetical protein [Bremerella volcania]QDU75446.1 hypothetical protein Pan97_24780 [Bremerella volcania]
MICITKPTSPKNTMPSYQIPQKAYDMAINVPTEIANDDDIDPKVRLMAVKEIRATIDHSHEIELINLQRKALENSGKTSPVIVVEDEAFFENDAHAQADRANEEDSGQRHPGPGDPSA